MDHPKKNQTAVEAPQDELELALAKASMENMTVIIVVVNRAYADQDQDMRDNSTGQKEQDVLRGLIKGGIIGRLGLNVRCLDTLYFSGFCQDSKDFRAVTTVHANCCKSITAKVTDLRAVLRDWKRFKEITADKQFTIVNATETFRCTGHWRCWNSWSTGNKTKV
ncbi:Nucleotide-diphospho-sugar transferase [Parasponia andersonii]|uniref:Nucleotide-diphospho-sugar transferase n=1 Tax=Parasponia andersonii TaxID=3476 RepID=A0A2P5CCV1_PARAD|nr:Nucleotide-diphospho-sugar transferase [Parasponia andersonii]